MSLERVSKLTASSDGWRVQRTSVLQPPHESGDASTLAQGMITSIHGFSLIPKATPNLVHKSGVPLPIPMWCTTHLFSRTPLRAGRGRGGSSPGRRSKTGGRRIKNAICAAGPWHARAPGDPGAGGRTHCSAPCHETSPGSGLPSSRGSPSLSSMRSPPRDRQAVVQQRTCIGAG